MLIRDNDELVELYGKKFELKTAKSKDGRQYVELNKCLFIFFGVDNAQVKSYIEHIPSSYFKSVMINEEKIKFIDRMALGMILNHKHNFDFYKWVVGRHIATFENYSLELFCNASEKILDNVNDMEKILKTISRYDDLQLDLLHSVENTTKNMEEKILFYDELELLRYERRQYKNKLAFDELMKNFFEEHGVDRHNLEELMKAISKLHFVFEKKIYNERGTKVAHQEIKQAMEKKIASKKSQPVDIDRQKINKLNKMMRRAGIR